MSIPAVLADPTGGVLVASPSTSLRERVRHSFYEHRWPVQEAVGGADALLHLETGNWQVLYLDRRLHDLDAEELIQIINRRFPGITVVMLDSDSGYSLPGFNSGWVGEGERLTLPVADSPQVPMRAVARAQVAPLPGMIGTSEPMQRLYQLARLVASRSTTVLITGPTGTGKELVARALHQLSPRAKRPFVVLNCAAIPEALLESELFGHVRGAFTGAVQAYSGRIRSAEHGTLFLDEVGELPLGMQAKLLRFLDQKEVQKLGSAEAVRVDVRVVAATNADLECQVTAGQFRADLYYRLSTFPLEVPSLAERIGDIEALCRYFLRPAMFLDPASNLTLHPAPRLSPEALALLESHPWAGNVRELQQVIERAGILVESGPEIRPEHLYFPLTAQRLKAVAKAG